jgi:hypothetical protein
MYRILFYYQLQNSLTLYIGLNYYIIMYRILFYTYPNYIGPITETRENRSASLKKNYPCFFLPTAPTDDSPSEPKAPPPVSPFPPARPP